MRGSHWRVSNEQIRGATSEGSLVAELVNRYLHSTRADFKKNRGARKYVDATSEGPPWFPGDPSIGEKCEPDEADVEESELDRETEAR